MSTSNPSESVDLDLAEEIARRVTERVLAAVLPVISGAVTSDLPVSANANAPLCKHGPRFRRSGPKGPFWGCPAFVPGGVQGVDFCPPLRAS